MWVSNSSSSVALSRNPFTERGEQRVVGVWIVIGASRAAERGEPAPGQAHGRRPGGGPQFRGDAAAQLGALRRGGADDGDGRVVHADLAVPEALREGVERPELHHVQGAQAHHLRYALAPGGSEPVGSGGQDAAHQVVRELTERQVQDAGEQSLLGE